MEKIIGLSNATKLKGLSEKYREVADSFVFSHIVPGSDELAQLVSQTPLKINGTMILLMIAGSDVKFEINLENYVMRPGTFLVAFPGNVIKIDGYLPGDIEMYALFFDTKFLQNININMAAIALPPALERPKPVQHLDNDEIELLRRYFELIHASTSKDVSNQINRSITSSLAAAMFYQLVQFYHKRLSANLPNTAIQKGHTETTRRNDYVREFLRLVHLHYVRERSVSFYASKLFISPKYLSLLVKESTGRSAAKWIDEFVVMEAKNMLRFSGKNIQQVAYALNFPTQSSFGKYFKHITGMSPTEYQKS